MKVAVVGTHCSGKTTLASRLHSQLKREGVRAALSREVARESLLLAAGEVSPFMQMDLFGRQISAEMTSRRNCDVVLCDRSVFDILAYTKVLLPDSAEKARFIDAMEAFIEHYRMTYDLVLLSKARYPIANTQDKLRPLDHELQAEAAESIEATLRYFQVTFRPILFEEVDELALEIAGGKIDS